MAELRSWIVRTVVAGLAAAGLLLGAASQGFADTGVTRVRFGGSLSDTRVVIELDRSASGRLIEGDGASVRRAVLALPGVAVAGERSGTGFGIVSGWRLEEAAGAARLQLEFRQNARVVRRFLLPPADGVSHYRYVVDVAPAGGAVVAARAPEAEPVRTSAGQRSSPPAVVTAPRARSGPRVIVIDAGHGGRDPGALGARHRESAITLNAAQALKARLERGGYRVIMTRSRDVFIPLQERVRIARNARADLFISLHADAGPNAEARGATVYTLSDQGSDRAARRMLGDSWFMNVDLPGADRSVNQILLDLTQRATVNESSRFAGLLLTGVGEHVRLRPSGHRSAGFVVLLAPDVPAVLLEMGFMTNAEDERGLGDTRRMRRLMNAVGDSIDRYFAREVTIAATGGAAGGP